MSVYFEEIEIGPHFITFYTKQLPEMRDFCKLAWVLFKEDYPELVSINHPDFEHWENDPLVYHRFGEPNHWREAYRHFHINTDSKPSEAFVAEITDWLIGLGAKFDKIVKITNNEDFKLDQDDYYPPRKMDEGYLAYIARLKSVRI